MSNRGILVTALFTVIGIILLALMTFWVGYHAAYSANRAAAGAVTISTNSSGQPVAHISLSIQQEVGVGPNAAWLGYQTRTNPPHPGTIFTVPANALVTMDIHNFDSTTALRNYFFTKVQGTIGGVEYVNGKRITVMNPDDLSHTFTFPAAGVSVPMMGIPNNARAGAFEDMRFSFRAPSRKGVYRWQCIVPCGWGTYGNGGPMGEIGYMSGLITVN
ncbi:MAG TPA: hypothetical protein VFB58_14310 [Chloroflexota bacterium]|nr:hypothetical protein [Chloroflexota bacterium]